MPNREHAAQPPPATGDAQADRPLVLIVDDEAPIAEVLALIVREAGYAPMVARNGRQALELACAHWPVLVLTDMMMPLLDGAGLIAALHAEAALENRRMPPVIILTAGGLAEARATGAEVVLRKPFDLTDLERHLVRLLRR